MSSVKMPGFTAGASLREANRYYAVASTTAPQHSSGKVVPQQGGPRCRFVDPGVLYCCYPNGGGCRYEPDC
jgi:hypothetical protein